MEACPDPLVLAEAADPAHLGRDQIHAHAASCARCRGILAELAAEDVAVGPRGRTALLGGIHGARGRTWIPFAAAAALLVTAGGLWSHFHFHSRDQRPGATATPSPSAPVPPAPFLASEGMLEAAPEGDSLILGQAGSLTLKGGSRLLIRRQGPAPELTLLEGALWLENPGEPLILRAGEAMVQVEDAVLLLERFPRARKTGALWLSEALASEVEAGARLCVISGTVLLRVEGQEERRLEAGQEALLQAGGKLRVSPLGPLSLSWRGDQGWARPAGLPLRLEAGEHALAHPAREDAWAWEALLRRADPRAAASLCFVADGKGWQVPLGVPWGEPGKLLRVRMELRDGWVRLVAGPYEILRKPLAALPEMGEPGPAIWGLKVWGGSLEVVDSRWRDTR